MIVGAGGNTTVQVGDDGILVVDTKLATASAALLAAIQKISAKPIRYVVNTHWHADHVGSNELIAKSGSTIAGGNVSGAIADAGEGAAVIAHENVLVRMSGQETPPPFEAWPTVTLFMPQKDIYFNGEADRDPASAGGAYRRRQPRVLPPLRRRQHRRRVHDDGLPRDPARGRRRHRRRRRRA